MQGLEETLCAMLSEKCDKTPEEIHALFFDGKDHWFTADQAAELGLIDGTYDADPVPADSTPEQVYQACLNKRNGQPKSTGWIDKLKAHPALLGCVTGRDIIGRIDDMAQEIETYKARELEREGQELFGIVDKAIKEGRMGYPQRDSYIALLRADRASGEAVIAALPRQMRIMDIIESEAGRSARTDKSSWILAEYRKYAPQDLQRDPRLYASLLEDERDRDRKRQR